MGSPDAVQTVPLTNDTRLQLREAAARLGMTPGALGRVLIVDGLGRLEALAAVIDAERAATHERHSRAGAENRRLGWERKKETRK